MSTPQTTITCSKCGATIDADGDTPDRRTPCPVCGGSKRVIRASPTGGQLTNYTLDNFVAHQLSLLTECGATEVAVNANWLSTFILGSIFNFRLLPPQRAYIFNFLRRAEGAFSAYGIARASLIEYVETPSNVVSPYFKALLNFELCIAQCCQAYELLRTASGENTFEKGDCSKEERLNTLYNDSKHLDDRIDKGSIPTEATVPIWITNRGLESAGAELSFSEILEILQHVSWLAERLSKPNLNINSQPSAPESPPDSPASN